MVDAKLAPSLPRWMVDDESLHFQWRHRGAHLYDLPAGYSGRCTFVAAADDDRPETGEKFIFPTVLW